MPKGKGSGYEREVCKNLSLWWTGGVDDDVFWRTAMSGGRATVRKRKGKDTRGHVGDICATDATGIPLTSLITIEVKRGYRTSNVGEILDACNPNQLQQDIEGFFEQAWKASKLAKTPYWMLIHRRDRRRAMCYFPIKLYNKLCSLGCVFNTPTIIMSADVKMGNKEYRTFNFAGVSFENFLSTVDPEEIRYLNKRTITRSDCA